MERHIVKIKSIAHATHDVLRIVTEKPDQYHFLSGQATEIAINKNDWQEQRRPFTFTCLPENDYLEFTIKTYPAHHGVTNELLQLGVNDELILHEVFGTIAYKSEGVFIAGGAGVTPFISIFRDLESKGAIGDNRLILANKTKKDIILADEFTRMLGNNFINILSAEKAEGYASGYISKAFLEENIPGLDKTIYLCGPDPMMEVIEQQLAELGINTGLIVKEAF